MTHAKALYETVWKELVSATAAVAPGEVLGVEGRSACGSDDVESVGALTSHSAVRSVHANNCRKPNESRQFFFGPVS